MISQENKYIVPFLGYNDSLEENEFIGTAFFVNPNILITAGHNIANIYDKSFKSYAILFEKKIITLDQPIYFKFGNKLINEGNYKDLAIYRLNVNFEKAFTLSTNEVKNGDRLYCYYYRNSNDSIKNKEVTINLPSFSYKNYPNEHMKARLVKYNNCFNLKEKLETGSSGCPIFVKNKVLGMILYGPTEEKINVNRNLNFGATALKSKYILSVLDKI